ncbi:hypothetical protein H4J59_08820 [Colwellia sp. MB02u-10]|uniref:hypothetical protein n=1 Tax=Colwellia sp. MB02u-10 TaxID=2759828 RepID=UPI0015F35E33|nr:hypothetical protein [Colwellia sp. MB02u-10]MBA6341088.1 hypothetical protein [Colwellia sp. MB02u-10]
MNIIFVADIFGLTDEFKHLCQQVTANLEQGLGVENGYGVEKFYGVKYHMVGPYQQQPKCFTCERDAYQYFTENVSLEGYVNKLEQKLLAISGSKLLVGFSVGGSAIWQLYAQGAVKQSLGAICFYSSQIRHLTQLTPNIATRLILPSTEPHFSVAALRAVLRDKPTVTIEQSEYLHGFMNQLSVNYDGDAYLYYLTRLADLLSKQYSEHILEEKILREYYFERVLDDGVNGK